MENSKEETVRAIRAAARSEFLEKGYEKATLRDICRKAGVTTGAFYFSFPDKDALMKDILEPFLARANILMASLAETEVTDPQSGPDNDEKLITFLSEYKEETLILLEKSHGSSYEEYGKTMLAAMTEAFRSYYRSRLSAEPDRDLMEVLARMRLEGFIAIIRGGFDLKRQKQLTRQIGIHAEAGTEALLKEIGNENGARQSGLHPVNSTMK